MKDRTNKDRQARYRERMREAGFVQALILVHREDKKELIQFANRLRKARIVKSSK